MKEIIVRCDVCKTDENVVTIPIQIEDGYVEATYNDGSYTYTKYKHIDLCQTHLTLFMKDLYKRVRENLGDHKHFIVLNMVEYEFANFKEEE